MAVVGRWWNGVWGRIGRRDVWLSVSFRVTARQGGSEGGRVLSWDFATEDAARAMVDRLRAAEGPGEWRELTLGRAASAPADEAPKDG
ncbi:hypothetical protein Aab01nite_86070 [Paractinoplanes abujensis]|uniref:Uncharacterized protein n=1 Tax=Paractinoplanes abujensis TaxID=882441 RepID=A0A7W7CVG6_9ACTN|nr:hypothetical protein [Actinoplanes abujensis]GID25017.1 hypothetical protein Aab01nite_86070 [Actinoplanes abujensis]